MFHLRPRHLLVDDSGVVAPLTIFIMIALLGFCALALDGGMILAQRRALQNAADAAALAGVREIEQAMLTGNSTYPTNQAALWAANNGVNGGTYTGAGTCSPDGKPTINYNAPSTTRQNSWQVNVSRKVNLVFGGVVGIKEMCVTAKAVAVVTNGASAKLFPYSLYGDTKLSPFAKPGTANQSCDPNASTLNQYCFVLKEGSSGSDKGNFGILNFTCSGTSQQKSDNYIYWTEYGYGSRTGEVIPGPIPPNEWTVCTYTGNTASGNGTIEDWVRYNLTNPGPYCPKARVDPDYKYPDFRCPLIGLLPILKEGSLGTGSSTTVTIVKFAVFEIVGLTSGPTGHRSIIGQFLEWAAAVGPTQYPSPDSSLLNGLITIRLVE